MIKHDPHLICGYVAIIGRPNVGKSTLLNRILGRKISIISSKPQTTRHRILGLKTIDNVQAIYVDTPGLHQKPKQQLHRQMNRLVGAVIKDVDIIVFLVDGTKWTEEDDMVLNKLREVEIPVLLAINKVDKIADKQALLPYIQEKSQGMAYADIIPISAKKGFNIDSLEKKIANILPESVHFFPEDQVTDRSVIFLVAEFIREKLIRFLGDELPYALTVDIEKFTEKPQHIHIAALIIVSKDSQKGIVVGKGGSTLKQVGQLARQDIETLLNKKVYLQLWVKVKRDWANDKRQLYRLGFDDEFQ